MINWPHVAFNALWIFGCALALAAFSYSHWLAHARGLRTRQVLASATFQLPFSIGLGLVSLGLFFLSRGWLEHGVWAVFAALFAWQAWGTWVGHLRG
jgi:hypothetical protein